MECVGFCHGIVVVVIVVVSVSIGLYLAGVSEIILDSVLGIKMIGSRMWEKIP